MYSVICPGCGTTLITNVAGVVWIGCQACHYYGQLLATPTSQTPAPTTRLTATAPVVGASLQVGALDLGDFAEEVYQKLLTLPLAAFEAPLPAAWDRLQEALDTLHAALGGRHMGAYAPSGEPVAEAVVRVTTRALLLLWAVGHLQERQAASSEVNA